MALNKYFGGQKYKAVALHPAPSALAHRISQEEEIYRVSRVLRLHTRDTLLADRIARAFVIEGGKKNIDPALLIGVLLTEDATLDVHARSSVGARGLMQIMPFHSGKYGCVRGRNTPNCHTYPNTVLRYWRTAASQMVAELTE